MTAFIANRIMTIALELECPDIAIELFETIFGFDYRDPNPAKSILKIFREDFEESSKETWKKINDAQPINNFSSLQGNQNKIKPNNYVCTTAIKAYGRQMQIDKALAILPWFEKHIGGKADVFFMRYCMHLFIIFSNISLKFCL
jgi:hypothetical protein